MPLLTGVSIFCLANQNSLVTTTIFGGSNGNEGLSLLSLGLDWQFISSKPLWLPLQTLANSLVGYVICIFLFLGVYYGNVWRAKDFPFLSQLLFSENSTSSNYVIYNQTTILNDENALQPEALKQQGIPYFAGTYATFLLTNNLAITSTISHLLLWNWDDMKTGYSFLYISNLRKVFQPWLWATNPGTSQPNLNPKDNEETDPHYLLMRRYPECPSWWYIAILGLSVVVGIFGIYAAKSTLPWYGFIVSIIVSGIFILFFGAQAALTSYQGNVQPIV